MSATSNQMFGLDNQPQSLQMARLSPDQLGELENPCEGITTISDGTMRAFFIDANSPNFIDLMRAFNTTQWYNPQALGVDGNGPANYYRGVLDGGLAFEERKLLIGDPVVVEAYKLAQRVFGANAASNLLRFFGQTIFGKLIDQIIPWRYLDGENTPASILLEKSELMDLKKLYLYLGFHSDAENSPESIRQFLTNACEELSTKKGGDTLIAFGFSDSADPNSPE
ncbi:hypothetical protein KC622_03740, partial [Candidatus Dojkabacteria bacterium]|nr:hypothetical protein [Candidatus Dojkabacteria bacterium]